MAAKKKPARGTKKQFILGLPSDVSAKDVVEKARQAGISLTSAHVYTVRAGSGAKPAKKSSPPRAAARKTRSVARAGAATNDGDYVQRFVEATVNLGLSRSAELLKQLRAHLHG